MPAAQQTTAGNRLDVSGLIDFILDRFHNVHRAELPELESLARKVEAAHAEHPECPKGLADFISELADDLEMHMQKEEQVLFPMMRTGGHPMIVHPISMMRHEHVQHEDNLEQLRTKANNFAVPVGGCGSWHRLYNGLKKLSDDLSTHIATENGELFPRFESPHS